MRGERDENVSNSVAFKNIFPRQRILLKEVLIITQKIQLESLSKILSHIANLLPDVYTNKYAKNESTFGLTTGVFY